MHRFLKFSIVLPAMNESMNESKHKNIKEQISLKIKGLTKDHVVHQLKEIFFKIIFCSCTLTSVVVDEVFQPWRLIEQ